MSTKFYAHLKSAITAANSAPFRCPFDPIAFNPFCHRPYSSSPVVSTTGDNPKSARVSSLNEAEIAKFASLAETWWDPEGPFKPLHMMNPARVSYIRSALCRHFKRSPHQAKPLKGLRIADIGCGGGILSEPLARLGAEVTGVDAVEKNINISFLHSKGDLETCSINYVCTTAEKLVEEGKAFDAVIALEVIEHVSAPGEFAKSLADLTCHNGATIISTINRTMRAYSTTIVAAEYVLRWLPIGTHQWSSFITPEEIALMLHRASVEVTEMAGFEYNPLTGKWSMSDDLRVNYIAFGVKKELHV